MSFNKYFTLTGYFLQSHSFHEVKQAECERLLVLENNPWIPKWIPTHAEVKFCIYSINKHRDVSAVIILRQQLLLQIYKGFLNFF